TDRRSRSASKPIRRAAAGVEHDHLCTLWNSTRGDELLRHGQRAPAFRRRVDAAGARQLEGRRTNRVFAHPERFSLALAQRAQNEPVAKRSRHAQAAGVRRRILPGSGLLLAGRERAHDRGATVRLRDDHVGHRHVFGQPAAVAHFGEHFPHADQPGAAAGWIHDVCRQPPAKLLGDLDAHGLLSFDPIRLEGKKTMGIEVAEQLGWRLPTHIVYPTGGGTGLIGMWKVFAEMRDGGWLPKDAAMPHMVVAQADGCAPIVRAFAAGEEKATPWENPTTHASGLRVPGPLGDRLILRALRESKGEA